METDFRQSLQLRNVLKAPNRIQAGFTLLEFMIVVVIIAIALTLAISTYQDFVLRARLTNLVIRLETTADRIRYYYQETGSYPPDTHIVPPPKVGNAG